MFEKFIKIASFFLFSLGFAQNAFDPVELNDFYDEFVCEEKDVTFEVDLTQGCTGFPRGPNQPPLPPPNPPIPPPPPPPPAPPPKPGYLPIVLVNNTGLPNSQVFFTMFGRERLSSCSSSALCPCPTGDFTFVNFGPQPGPVTDTGSLGGVAGTAGPGFPTSAQFSYSFADFASSGPVTVYVPFGVDSGEILFSINSKLSLAVGINSIAVPNPGLEADLSYHIVYGQMEMTLLPTNCQDPSNLKAPLVQFAIDTTCVDYFGLPLQFTYMPGGRPVGILQTRHNVIESIITSFNTAHPPNALNTWNSLVLKDGTRVLRILSPGAGLFEATPQKFDVNYFDNAAQYGYSWAEGVWYGANAYYRTHPITLVTGGDTFSGTVSGRDDNTGNAKLTLRSTKTGHAYTIPWVSSPTLSDSTSAALFNVSTYLPGMEYTASKGSTPVMNPTSLEAQQITEMLSAAIIAGIIPDGRTKDKLTIGGPSNGTISTYYLENTSLPSPGTTTGPWFDLYSKGLIGTSDNPTGNIVYAYPYDDYLYAQSSTHLKEVAVEKGTLPSNAYVVIQVNNYSDN